MCPLRSLPTWAYCKYVCVSVCVFLSVNIVFEDIHSRVSLFVYAKTEERRRRKRRKGNCFRRLKRKPVLNIYRRFILHLSLSLPLSFSLSLFSIIGVREKIGVEERSPMTLMKASRFEKRDRECVWKPILCVACVCFSHALIRLHTTAGSTLQLKGIQRERERESDA